MRVSIFGANGGTGRLLTERSLAQGHRVTALVRRPAEFPFRDRIEVVEGSAFDLPAVKRTVEAADVVFSALGAHSPFQNENVLPRAVPVIIEAMKQAGVRRIIALGSAGARPDAMYKQPEWRRWLVEEILYRFVMKWPVYEQRVQYRELSASGLDWTMVMPPVLTNGRPRGRYRIDGDALPRNGNRIARADVAEFMMKQVGSREWVGRGVYLSY
jgi:uncharacterized protein